MYPYQHDAEERMTDCQRISISPNDLQRRILNQAARELLLAQSSDWAFQIYQGTTVASGKLGILLVGFGAVSTTFVAGVEAIRKGTAEPIGSLTQMGTIRLGKRTDNRCPKIKDFVPLAGLDDMCVRRVGYFLGFGLRRGAARRSFREIAGRRFARAALIR
jgi:hypothetical protein